MFSIRNLGEYGSNLVTSATAQTGTWFAIYCCAETVFSTLTDISVTADGTWASVTFAAGSLIFGGYTNFTLTSGAVLAYKTRSA